MSEAGALLAALAALAATPPSAPAPPPLAVGALEVRADGKLVALARPAELQSGDPTAGPARIERVDLVWGCRGDRRRAVLLEGDQRVGAAPPDACVVRVDVRPPCPPEVDDAGLDDADARALAAAVAEQQRAVLAAHQQRMARLGVGFSQWGPGLRVVVRGGGPLTLTSARLALERCECEGSTARALGDQRVTIVLPKLAGPTVLWWPVPQYLGALHRLARGPAPEVSALSFVDPFHAEDAGETEAGDAPVSAFSAPAGCDCAPCDTLE